ncbi:MAG: hypothetical protein CBC06_007425 [bacterium TMED46]|nr:MAG: hypothetical protein CBC06_007425 [bacterium TMED46]
MKIIFKYINIVFLLMTFHIGPLLAEDLGEQIGAVKSCYQTPISEYFSYPHSLIPYSISGSSLIEFTLDQKGRIEDLQFIKSLGYAFDQSILDGLEEYISKEIVLNSKKLGSHYRLQINFEN